MACLSPSPSGRRLSELLEEKQEPFSLDIHLLEKGCSSRLIDGYDTVLCWPAAGNDGAAAVLKRLTSKKNKAAKKKQQPTGGLLQLLLSKILRGRAAAAAPRKPAALQFSDSFKTAATTNNFAAVAPATSPCPDHLGAVKTGAGGAKAQDGSAAECCYSSDCEYSDDEKQQLSPVSVLEPHPFESSPAAHHFGVGGSRLSPSKNAMDVFRELLDAAYSPALLTQLLARTDDLLLDGAAADDDEEDEYYYGGGYRGSPKSRRDDESAAAYWDAHRAALARVSELVASEVPASKLAPADVRPEREGVGAEVAAAVLDALVRELVAELGSGGRC
ncbi:hypothetical protein C2845_PM18G09270 [Panicum miliaceum]|uniref:DUF4378 domain-containing protein n=1 Tax=Panicum miliaceum TaxID=4540 RepID=A0A3L6PGS2_PANMI|nr:hypothetical protein C2845_PM18G09270 [Panicum miliaceum]